MRSKLPACAALLSVALTPAPMASAAQPAASPCVWKATALSAPAGATSTVTATDNLGGFSGVTGSHAVAWKDGKYSDYGTLMPFPWTHTPSGENRAGTIAGTASFTWWYGAHGSEAFITRGQALSELPIPQGYTFSAALGINDAGDVTGYVWSDASDPFKTTFTTVRWPAAQPGSVVELPGLPPTSMPPQGVDQDGSVLLYGNTVWRDGVVTTLGSLPGLLYEHSLAISNGRVLGYGSYNGKRTGVYWDQQGAAHILPRSSYNLSNTNPDFSINRDGLITGRIDEAHGGDELKGTGYGVWKLGSWVSEFGAVKTDVPAIAGDDATVAGFRTDGDGQPHPYLWRCG